MYTLYTSPAAFYECLTKIMIALLCITAAQKNVLYYPLTPVVNFLICSKPDFVHVTSKGVIANGAGRSGG